MKAKVDRDKLSTDLVEFDLTIKMSDRAIYDLSVQKQALLRAIENADEDLFPDESDKLTGILHLIDHIQDHLVDKNRVDEEIVFPLVEESEDEDGKGKFDVKEPPPGE